MTAAVRLHAAVAVAIAVGPSWASAQCCGATPTVAYSPVIAPVAAAPVTPVVYQTTASYDGWYPGKYLTTFTRSLFGGGTTYQTNYAAPATYTAAYAPTSYTAPAFSYTAAYAPAPMMQTAYRPTYPATWGPVVGAYSVGYAPLVQTVARPVELSAVAMAPTVDSCGACSACGVTQAVYDGYAPTTGCSSCAAGAQATYLGSAPASTTPPIVYGDGSAFGDSGTPRPALAPNETPTQDRSALQKQITPDATQPVEPTTEADGSGAFFQAPPLFDPRDKLTRREASPRHPAPTWTADYRGNAQRTPAVHANLSRGAITPAKSVGHQVGASGWTSAAR
ncbi:MAG: hypothetical protein ACRCT8_17410 [Lacipirellulaceae bacterium]